MKKKRNHSRRNNSLQDCEPARIDGGYMKKVLSQAFGNRKAIAQ